MSTRAHGGFRLAMSDLPGIHRVLMDWRAELDVLHRAELAAITMRLATGVLDKAAVAAAMPGRLAAPDTDGRSPMGWAADFIGQRQKRMRESGMRDPLVDFGFEISLMPHGDRVYGLVHTDRSAWHDLWMAKPCVEDYGYWNNADGPEDIDESEWSARGRTWDAILDTHLLGVPSMLGFGATCTLEHVHVTRADYEAAIPGFDSARCRRHADK